MESMTSEQHEAEDEDGNVTVIQAGVKTVKMKKTISTDIKMPGRFISSHTKSNQAEINQIKLSFGL